MKKCQFCAEEIQDEAIKCKHCGEFLKKPEKGEWYFKTSTLILAFFLVGPLALPLIWFNPGYSRQAKIIASIVILILSVGMGVLFVNSVKNIVDYYDMIYEQLQ